MARTTRLNDRLIQTICKLVERGNYPETAAVASGVPASTFWQWVKQGKAGQQPYEALLLGVDRARAKAEADLLELVRSGDTKNKRQAKAAAWILERTRSKRFGAVIRHRVEDEVSKMLDIAQATLDAESYRKLEEAWARYSADQDSGEADSLGGPEQPPTLQ
jgi:hypothetical protein